MSRGSGGENTSPPSAAAVARVLRAAPLPTTLPRLRHLPKRPSRQSRQSRRRSRSPRHALPIAPAGVPHPGPRPAPQARAASPRLLQATDCNPPYTTGREGPRALQAAVHVISALGSRRRSSQEARSPPSGLRGGRGVRGLRSSAPPARCRPQGRGRLAAADQGRSLRDDGKYRRAHDTFVTCSSDACPKVVARSCAQWLRQLDDATPTVVLGAKDEGGANLTTPM